MPYEEVYFQRLEDVLEELEECDHSKVTEFIL